MKTRILIVLAVGLTMHAAKADPELRGSPNDMKEFVNAIPGKVTIYGFAERLVEADRAIVQVSVVTTEKQLKASLEQNAEIRGKIMTILTTGGISTNRIHMSRFSSTPLYSSWSGKVKEYRIESTVRVHAESEKEVQLAGGIVDSMEEVQLASLTFETSKKEEITQELIKEALQQVEQRRGLYQEAVGVRLVPREIDSLSGKDGVTRVSWGATGMGKAYAEDMSSGQALSFTLHALQQKAPEFSQFQEATYKVGISVTYDVLPTPDKEKPAGN